MAWRKPKDLRDWLGVFFRHQKKFVVTALLIAVAVVIGSFKVPREYRAEARFERVNQAPLDQINNVTINRNLSLIRRTIGEQIRGRAAVEQLLDDLNMTRELPHNPDGTLTALGLQRRQDMIRRMQTRLGINFALRDERMDIVSVTYTDTDRLLAPRVANQAVENYIRKTVQQMDEMLRSAQVFYQQNVDRCRQLAVDLEARKMRFERDNPGLSPSDPGSLQSRLVDLRATVTTANEGIELKRSQRDALAQWVKDQPDYIESSIRGQNPVVRQLLARRDEMQRQLDQQRFGLGRKDAHPAIIKLLAQISELDRQIAEQDKEVQTGSERVPNTQRLEAESRVRTLTAELTSMERRRDEAQAAIEQLEVLNRNFFVIRNDYQKIQRELSDANNQLQFWEQYLRRTQIALQVEVGDGGVSMAFTQRAQELSRPTTPTLPLIAGAAIGAGLAAGLLLIILAELLDHSFQSVDQAVDDLKLPVLGSVAEIVTPAELLRRRLLNWALFPGFSAVMALGLAFALGLVYLSFERPQTYDSFLNQPIETLRQVLDRDR